MTARTFDAKQITLWIGALVVGIVLGLLGIDWIDHLANFVATMFTRLFQLLAVPTIALAVPPRWPRSATTRTRATSSAARYSTPS